MGHGIHKRRYRLLADFNVVHSLLTDIYSRDTLNSYLLPQFFEYAHTHPFFNHKLTHRFGIWEDNGKHALTVWMTDKETDKIDLLSRNGYTRVHTEPVRIFSYHKPFPDDKLPDGYTIVSLEDENDYRKIHECLWKGFDHGDNPDDDIDCRIQMQSGPNFRKDLTTVIKAPNGDYACFAGILYSRRL